MAPSHVHVETQLWVSFLVLDSHQCLLCGTDDDETVYLNRPRAIGSPRREVWVDRRIRASPVSVWFPPSHQEFWSEACASVGVESWGLYLKEQHQQARALCGQQKTFPCPSLPQAVPGAWGRVVTGASLLASREDLFGGRRSPGVEDSPLHL